MTVARLVNIVVERDTPLDVLAACREVLPTAELVYAGHGRWWLGHIKASPAMEIQYEPPAVGQRVQYDLQRQGFRWLGEYSDAQLTAGYLRKELEFMFGRTEHELDADFVVAMDHSEGEYLEMKKREMLRQKAEADGRSIHAHVFRQRRSVLVH